MPLNIILFCSTRTKMLTFLIILKFSTRRVYFTDGYLSCVMLAQGIKNRQESKNKI